MLDNNEINNGGNEEIELGTDLARTDGSHRTGIEVFKDLVRNLPLNEYGLPKFLYRPDIIGDNFDELHERERVQILQEAALDIQYAEGFPAFDDGTPIWGPLPYEDQSKYNLFEAYRDLALTYGARRVDLLGPESTASTPRETLLKYHTYYYWALRCKAHDLFQVAASQKLRERRILQTTNAHYLEAEKLLGVVLNYFGEIDEETGRPAFMKELTPKVGLDMLDKLVKIQRVSLGLAAHGSSAGEEGIAPKNATMELILRTIAKTAGDTQESRSQALDMLLNDPEAAMQAQELILKFNSNGKERTIKEIEHTSDKMMDEISG